MIYIKKLVMKGFKSFARETVMEFDEHMNTVVGPNGSGKSNITDALCFVLGRLSIKSMRAAKASHLIFSGNKEYKGANEALVEVVFDNSDKSFAIEKDEIILKRIVRKNGQSIYKINNEVKTRQEVLELLGQAGIDPHGFNIILQGEIERFVKMPPEERRKILEEVAGISVYEMRKEKALKEIEKTDEKLRQVNAILRERTNYLRNLEEEREQALKFKKLEETIKKCKASIIYKNILGVEKELDDVLKKIEEKTSNITKKEAQIQKLSGEITLLNEKIENISKKIQTSSGIEQDSLLEEISLLKQEIAGMGARKENYENQLAELERRKQTLQASITSAEKEIQEMSKEKGKDKKRQLEEKKAKLDELEELKRQSYQIKSNISTISSQIDDKKTLIHKTKSESNFILMQIQQIEAEIKIKSSIEQHKEALARLKQEAESKKKQIAETEDSILKKEKLYAIQTQIINEAEKIKTQVSKLDICPLCKTKITKEHTDEVIRKSNTDIENAKKTISETEKHISEERGKLERLKDTFSEEFSEINNRNIDILKLQSINEKKEQLKRGAEQEKNFEDELKILEQKKKFFGDKLAKIKITDEQYESLKLEVNELARSEERNLGTEITIKQRELERIRGAIKQNLRDNEEIIQELESIRESLEEKEKITEEKEEQAEILKRKYQKMFEEKNSFQDKVRFYETHLMHEQNEKRLIENDANNLKIFKAQFSAKIETFKEEFKQYERIEIISLPTEKLKEKLDDSEHRLATIGSVNLRALEVYDEIKKEYEKVREKVEQLEKEKAEILKAIEQIDRKKKKTFMHTLEQINQLFSRNFSHLSEKGIVTLEPQDKKEVFNAGLDITVKVGGGKYFDVTSLSGGEQTLVALSLIFAIQEYSPYCFYIFDEIDAALDRRNSEKLAYLLKKYMKNGQYLIITHNDSIISESSNILYGVSMQEGISKILSLQI